MQEIVLTFLFLQHQTIQNRYPKYIFNTFSLRLSVIQKYMYNIDFTDDKLLPLKLC